jgi:hypothetical protein
MMLSVLLGLVGRMVFIEVRSTDGLEVPTLCGTLAAGDEVWAEFEREHGVGGPVMIVFCSRCRNLRAFLTVAFFRSPELLGRSPEQELLIRLAKV